MKLAYTSSVINLNQQQYQLQQQLSLQQNQPTLQASTSDFKSKKISSLLKSNLYTVSGGGGGVVTSSMNNYSPDQQLSIPQYGSINNVGATASNAGATVNFNGIPSESSMLYNNQLISIPLSDLSVVNQHSLFQAAPATATILANSTNRFNTFKIRDQINSSGSILITDSLGNQQQQHIQLLGGAKVNKISNILNNLSQQQQIQQTQDQISLSNLTPTAAANNTNANTASARNNSKALIKTFKCNMCNKCFYYENYLKKHILSKHSCTPLYSCSFCGKGFSNKSNAKSHVNNSHLDYACQLCGKTFKSKALTQRHVNTAHSNVNDLKLLEPVKHTKVDAKIIEFNNTNNNNNNNNLIGGQSLLLDSNANNMNILNLIPIGGNSLDLTGNHSGEIVDLNNNLASHPDLNNINIINFNFENNNPSNNSNINNNNNVNKLISGFNFSDFNGIHQVTGNSGGNVAIVPSTFTLNFLNNQQQQQQQHHHIQQHSHNNSPSNNNNNQQQQQTFVLNQSSFINQTLNSASYFIE